MVRHHNRKLDPSHSCHRDSASEEKAARAAFIDAQLANIEPIDPSTCAPRRPPPPDHAPSPHVIQIDPNYAHTQLRVT